MHIPPPPPPESQMTGDRWMGHQPRADLEVGSGGQIFLCFRPCLISPQKSEHFEERNMG